MNNLNYWSCPINCKYCVINNVETRKNLWEKSTIVWLNKAVTIINPPFNLEDKEKVDEFYNFPYEILVGDIVWFNAITDPFWPKYSKELEFFLEKVSPIAKIVTCVTKFPISEKRMQYLSKFKNFRLVVSITWLDNIENSSTDSRLKTLALAKKYNIQAFPLIHPYISWMSDLSFLDELKSMGYNHVDVKWFRYNDNNMQNWINPSSRELYIKTNEEEILIEDWWREKAKNSKIQLLGLKDWYLQTIPKNSSSLTRQEAKEKVEQILKYANITSSDSHEQVIKSSIDRRL